MKNLFFFIAVCLCVCGQGRGQDPHFSQFFMAPALLNPAMTGTSSEDWRVVSNFRQQWSNAGTPFQTRSISGDMKLMGKAEGENVLGISASLLSDHSMLGTFRSNYIQSALAYHLHLGGAHRLGLGMAFSYGSRRLDFTQMSSGEQFTSGGFDLTLPSGESALSTMKPFLSAGTGVLYSYQAEFMNIQAGLSAFHVNRPKQSFLQDDQQVLPARYAAHLNAEFNMSPTLLLYVNTAYQRQAKQQYLSVGGSAGIDISGGDRRNVFFAGAWIRSGDAVYPYVGLKVGAVQFGFSYDVTLSSQNDGPEIPRSFEFSLLFRQPKAIPGVIYCPWR